MAIEFAHRATSGVALLIVFGLFVLVRRAVPAGGDRPERQLRLAATWSLVTIVGEALIGAGIVLFEWVNEDSSVARTIAVPLHLVNTLLLLAALAMVVWLAAGGRYIDGSDRLAKRRVGAGLGLMVLVAATGAVTALADTLFPKETIGFDAAGAREAFLTDLRVFHPALAVAASIVIVRLVVGAVEVGHRGGRLRRWIITIVAVQLIAGVLNVVWFVPVGMQLLHLALADALWVTFVWFGAESMAGDRQPVRAAENAAPRPG